MTDEELYIYLKCVQLKQSSTDLVLKWAFEERVQFSLHEYKEHREMGLVSNSISIEVGSDPHLLAITVEREGRDMVGILVGTYTVEVSNEDSLKWTC